MIKSAFSGIFSRRVSWIRTRARFIPLGETSCTLCCVWIPWLFIYWWHESESKPNTQWCTSSKLEITSLSVEKHLLFSLMREKIASPKDYSQAGIYNGRAKQVPMKRGRRFARSQRRRVTNCGWWKMSRRHIGQDRCFVIHCFRQAEWYSWEQAKILTSSPLRYVARQIEHSDWVSLSESSGEGDGERQIITGDGRVSDDGGGGGGWL